MCFVTPHESDLSNAAVPFLVPYRTLVAFWGECCCRFVRAGVMAVFTSAKVVLFQSAINTVGRERACHESQC